MRVHFTYTSGGGQTERLCGVRALGGRLQPHAGPLFHAIQYLAGIQSKDKLAQFRALGGVQSYPSRTKDVDDVVRLLLASGPYVRNLTRSPCEGGPRGAGLFHRLGRARRGPDDL